MRLLEQGHLNWKAIWEKAQMVTLMFFSSNLWFCRNNSIPITRTKVCFIDSYFLNFRKCLISLYVCLFLFLSSPHLKFKYRTTLLKSPEVAAWQFLQTLNSQNHKLHEISVSDCLSLSVRGRPQCDTSGTLGSFHLDEWLAKTVTPHNSWHLAERQAGILKHIKGIFLWYKMVL